MVPGASHLPFVAPAGGDDVPDDELVLRDVVVDPSHVSRYRDICGFSPDTKVPGSYPHVLAFPLHLAVLTNPRFPFPAVGMVHIKNRITQHRPIEPSEPLSIRVSASALEPHPSGRQLSFRTSASVGDELVWEDTSSYLRRERRGGSGEQEGPSSAPTPIPSSTTWRVPRSVGRRYAMVSGDHNPIHVYRLPARLFGLPGVIAPGMWTKARCLAQLDSRLPDAYTVEVQFVRPIPLPAEVAFGSWPEGSGLGFAVHHPEKASAYLLGLVEPVEAR
jgi:acyl dehydratase